MQQSQQIAIISVIMLWALQMGDAGAGGRLKANGWTAACRLASELDKVEQKAAHRLATPMATVNDYLKQYFRTAIYTEAYRNGHHTAADRALLTYYASKADAAAAELTPSAVAKLATAVRDAARAEGSIRDFIGAMAQISAAATDGCLEIETGSNTHRPPNTPFTGSSAGCKLSTDQLPITDTTTEGFTQTGYDGGLEVNADVAANTDTTSDTCAITAAKASSRLLDGANGDSAIQGSPTFASGLYYIHNDGMQRRATVSLNTAEGKAPTLKAAHTAYLTTKYTPESYKFETADQLKESADFRTIYAMLVKKKDTIGQPEEAVIKDEIGGAFGDKGAMAKEYNTAFASAQVHNPNAKGTEKVPLTSLSTLKDLTATLAYYQDINTKALKRKIAELEKQINKGASKTQEQICNAIEDQNETS
uniref:Variant surface glycoprotein 1125.1311 n=1 Tax=Trypanosoma brucei TaxID=5691 RepID=M4SVA0_9TRYP|nr:variant surface glycoprotein 1376 [Trypanosoma brucei]APD73538.1 variant surface glycoprotein 1125.1311 [Trypanosoma brucei]